MRNTRAGILPFTLALGALAFADFRGTLTLQPESRLWIEGTSTVRSFKCTAGAVEATIEAAPGAVKSIIAGDKAVRSVAITVPAARLDCANDRMNEHMLKALKASQHPAIEFRVASYETVKADDGITGTLAGTLALGGVTRDITIDATARETTEGALRVAGTYELAMSDYGLRRPTLMMGALRVGDRVRVGFDVLLKE